MPHTRTRPRVIGVVLVGFLGLVALLPAAASASAPTRIAFSFAEDGVVDCGAFQDQYTDFYVVEGQVLSDADGVPVTVMLHYTHTSNDTNSVTGLTLHEHGHYLVVIDLLAGTFTTTGQQGNMNRPGTGEVVQGSGRRVYDLNDNQLFFAGGRTHNEVLLGEQIFCDALS
jgi:hypothetical protein